MAVLYILAQDEVIEGLAGLKKWSCEEVIYAGLFCFNKCASKTKSY